MSRHFPVIRNYREPGPRSVPWEIVEGHERQAHLNHGQSLERLAERSGLCPQELWCIVHDVPWRDRCSPEEAEAWLAAVSPVEVRQ